MKIINQMIKEQQSRSSEAEEQEQRLELCLEILICLLYLNDPLLKLREAEIQCRALCYLDSKATKVLLLFLLFFIFLVFGTSPKTLFDKFI